MATLSHPLLRVTRGSEIAYGGSQLWSEHRTTQEVGCGIIAAQDLMLHLAMHHPEYPSGIPADPPPDTAEAYHRLTESLRRRYFPLIPGFGITGIQIALGLNLYFFRHRIPLRAFWGITHRRLFSAMEEMLSHDLPVVLSVGQNFPRYWKKRGLNAYTKDVAGKYRPACGMRAHYVIATALDDNYITVSSWGRVYHLSRQEFSDFSRKYSIPLFCNIVHIKPCIRRMHRL